MTISPDDAIRALEPWIRRHELPCWHPVVRDGDASATNSKFGGMPWLAAGEKWPACQRCQRPLELFVQLDLADLPPEVNGRFGSGLLQLFYCSWSGGECDGDCGWEPFANQCSLVRIANPQGPSAVAQASGRFPPKSIVSWERSTDRPDPMEHERLGIVVDYHFQAVPYKPTEMACPELGLAFVGMEYVDRLCEVVHSQPGDKLGGWPRWVQGIEYPSCPRCGQTMSFVFQMDSEDHVPFMFGDCGIGHITQCPTHRDVVAFGWACS